MRRTLVFILGSMAACTPADDAPATVDAPVVIPPATSCLNPLPTTATPMVLLSGVVTDGSFSGSGNNLDAATIQASANGLLTTATSEASGIYQLDAATNGKPVDFLTLSKAGYTTTRYFPRAPIAKATSMPKIPVFIAAAMRRSARRPVGRSSTSTSSWPIRAICRSPRSPSDSAMTDGDRVTGRRRLARAAIVVGTFVAITLVLVRERSGEVGLWDWDTYSRLQFIHRYRPDLYLDGHLLYHGVMRALMSVGLGDVMAVATTTAMGAAAFLCLMHWICRRAALGRGPTWLVMVAATVGSPGLVALFLMAEDNVLYLPVVLAIFYVVAQPPGDRRSAVWRGISLGGLLAAAMLINVSLLVMLFAFPAGLVSWFWLRDRLRVLSATIAMGAAIVFYHLAHLVPFAGAKNALHEFLPQAVHLQDFQQSSTPLVSLARFAEYRGGLRAMALAPSVHLMDLPPSVRWVLVGLMPKIVFVLAACLVGWLVRFRAAELRAVLRTRFELLALFGIGLVFPYFYEPALIERWDVFWVGALFALVPFFQVRPSRVAVGLLVAILSMQGVGSLVAIAHHYGLAFADPSLSRMRAIAHEVVERNDNPMVLDFSIDRLRMADLTYRVGPRLVFLVRDEGGALTCSRLYDLLEVPVDLAELQQALRGKHAYFDPALSPHARQVLATP
ncbi:MAG: hypothetical protein NT062_32475 [Proteobacteria bacterium]|nr:hypothetical protein [Pseudomonadota bacterium]